MIQIGRWSICFAVTVLLRDNKPWFFTGLARDSGDGGFRGWGVCERFGAR